MANTWTTLLDVVYPVGSVYITGSTTSPASTFGGTWSQVKSGLIGCAGSTGLAANLSTGGNSTISVSQLPRHSHTVTGSRVNWYDSPARGMSFTSWSDSAHIGIDRERLVTDETGNGSAYYPAHISFNVYRRTA